MDARGENQAPFDERAVLEELERLREQIEQQQAERRKAEEEFERFVRSFKPGANSAPSPSRSSPEPQRIESPAVAVAPPRMPAAPQPSLSAVPQPFIPAAPEPLPQAPEPLPPAQDAFASAPATVAPQAPTSPARVATGRRSSVAVVGSIALVVLVAAGLLVWKQRDGGPESAPAASPARETSPQPGVPEPPAAAVPLPPPPRAELTTIRPVWIRVTVDGQRVLEREMPAGSRVPLAVQKVVVIRTGDAGAVRLSIAGEDRGFLGREGEVVTRTYNLSSPSAR